MDSLSPGVGIDGEERHPPKHQLFLPSWHYLGYVDSSAINISYT